MRFSLSGVVYDAEDLSQVSLRDILVFQQQTADMGREMSWADVMRIADLQEPTDDDLIVLTAVTVWASRRGRGESVTFEEAVSFPITALKQIPEPQDHKPKVNPTKARPGSGRAAKPVAVAVTGTGGPSPTTSPDLSTAV